MSSAATIAVKQSGQLLALEHAPDLGAERARGNRDRHRRGGAPHGVGGAGKENRHVPLERFEPLPPSRDQALTDLLRVQTRTASAPIASKRADIVVSEIARVVVGLGQRDAFCGEHVAEGAEMQRLAVRDHAVEVEDDRAQHQV